MTRPLPLAPRRYRPCGYQSTLRPAAAAVLAACLLALLPAPQAKAQDKMTGDAFDAHVTGRTITFRTETIARYGIEAYLSGRRVMWSAFDGSCMFGIWYESEGDICFLYEDDPEPKCWATYLQDGKIRAEFSNIPDGTVIYETDADEPLICNDLSS